ncbi:hypothetical protein [Candidatus Synchoanobacter obligatus]|uniref:Uncharacterized protein n=1 Tax=Candidatus Synchoanobacter obligatus TaxID=2919597 RepID=A0ABT1L3L8_9GAMM|nr:hypothetical protein [Candidatus Synchoanobacter obligatus]MCP8351805.1 hypothetical protein [Candidatus Synchoanobacter obligatus]
MTLPANIIHYADKCVSQLIYGIIFQLATLSICRIWLVYFPFQVLFSLLHTQLFSLYVAITLATLKKEEHNGGILNIIQNIPTLLLQSTLLKYLRFAPSTSDPKDQPLFSLQALTYLVCLICIYNIPALINLLLVYVILCLDIGQTNTLRILHLPALLASSCYGILCGYFSSKTAVFLSSLALYIVAIAFPSDAEKGDDLLQTISNHLNHSLQLYSDQFYAADNPADIILYSLVLIAMVSPLTNLLPLLYPIAQILYSLPALCIQSLLTTYVLGAKIEQLFFKIPVHLDTASCAVSPYLQVAQAFIHPSGTPTSPSDSEHGQSL